MVYNSGRVGTLFCSVQASKQESNMPPPQLPRVEELEFWSTGEKAQMKHHHRGEEMVSINADLYEKVGTPHELFFCRFCCRRVVDWVVVECYEGCGCCT